MIANMNSQQNDADLAPAELPAFRQKRLEEPPRALVLGGGPLGLEAALYASRLGHSVTLFEQGTEIAPQVRTWAHVSMFTPWASLRSSLGELAIKEAIRDGKVTVDKFPEGRLYPLGGEFVDYYLDPVAHLLGKNIHRETRAVSLGRSYLFPNEHAEDPEKRAARRFRLLTRSPLEEKIYTGDYILDATGITRSPRWMGAGGMPALGEMGSFRPIFHVLPDIKGRDRIHFRSKTTLLVGSGTSAASAAVLLAEVAAREPHGQVIWVSPSRDPLPVSVIPGDLLTRRDTMIKKANLLVTNSHPQVRYSPVTQIDAVRHSLANNCFHVTLQVNHETKRLTVDSVVSLVGYRHDAPSYERVLAPEETGVYIIGEQPAPPGDFLLSLGRTQIRDAFRAITGDAELDLYAQAVETLKQETYHLASQGLS